MCIVRDKQPGNIVPQPKLKEPVSGKKDEEIEKLTEQKVVTPPKPFDNRPEAPGSFVPTEEISGDITKTFGKPTLNPKRVEESKKMGIPGVGAIAPVEKSGEANIFPTAKGKTETVHLKPF